MKRSKLNAGYIALAEAQIAGERQLVLWSSPAAAPAAAPVAGLLDRLLNGAYIITMFGRSYRPQQWPCEHSIHASSSTELADQKAVMATEAHSENSDEYDTAGMCAPQPSGHGLATRYEQHVANDRAMVVIASTSI